jgi:hypothetical protein
MLSQKLMIMWPRQVIAQVHKLQKINSDFALNQVRYEDSNSDRFF